MDYPVIEFIKNWFWLEVELCWSRDDDKNRKFAFWKEFCGNDVEIILDEPDKLDQPFKTKKPPEAIR